MTIEIWEYLAKLMLLLQLKALLDPTAGPCVHPFSFPMQIGHKGFTGSERLLNIFLETKIFTGLVSEP